MNKEIIAQAIQDKQIIEFNYDEKHRIVEPYAIGKTTKNKFSLLSIQIGGHTSTSKLPNWRMFEIDKIKDIKVHKRKFAAYFHVYQNEQRYQSNSIYKVLNKAFDIDQQLSIDLELKFNEAIKFIDGQIYWRAKDLSKLLGYSRWNSFAKLLDKADTKSLDFQEKGKHDIMIDPRLALAVTKLANAKRPEVLFAKIYLAAQISKNTDNNDEQVNGLERIKSRMKLSETERYLSSVLFKHGADDKSLARIRSLGDSKLFGGLNTARIKEKLNAKKSRSLSDLLPDILIKAKEFAAALTSYNVTTHNIEDRYYMSRNHSINNTLVRQVLLKNSIIPEKIIAEIEFKQ